MDRPLISSGAVEPCSATRAPSRREARACRRDGADHGRRRRAARRPIRAGPPLPRDHRGARSPRRARRSETSSAPASSSRAPRTSTRSRAPTARSSARSGRRRRHRRRRPARPALARRDRGGGGESVSGGRQAIPSSITGKSGAYTAQRARPQFGAGDPYTLGVEEEFMLLDPETLRPRAAHRDGAGGGRTGTSWRPRSTRADAVGARDHDAGLPHGRRRDARAHAAPRHVTEVARERASASAPPGRIPFSLFERQRITAKDRYRALVDQLQYIARRELIFGMHIHVAVDDPTRRSRSSTPAAAPRRRSSRSRRARRSGAASRPGSRRAGRWSSRRSRARARRRASRLRRLRRGRRPARAHRLHRRLHAHLVGHPRCTRGSARSRSGSATPSRASTTPSRSPRTARRS